MLQPKRVKYRRAHKGHRRGMAQVGNTVDFGEFGLQAHESAWLTARQIEAARRAIVHSVKRGGKVWIRIFPGDKQARGDEDGQRQGPARSLGSCGQAGKDPF